LRRLYSTLWIQKKGIKKADYYVGDILFSDYQMLSIVWFSWLLTSSAQVLLGVSLGDDHINQLSG
jgi:hypothetical protein